MSNINITSNKNVPINKGSKASTTIVGVSGTLDGATVQFMRSNGTGLVPMENNAITLDTEYKVQHGTEMDVYVQVTGAGASTNLDLVISPFRA